MVNKVYKLLFMILTYVDIGIQACHMTDHYDYKCTFRLDFKYTVCIFELVQAQERKAL